MRMWDGSMGIREREVKETAGNENAAENNKARIYLYFRQTDAGRHL